MQTNITKETKRSSWNRTSKCWSTKPDTQRRTKENIYDMKNEEKEVQSERNDILKICTRFCTKLYSSTLLDQNPLLKDASPDSPEAKKKKKKKKIMTSEVKKLLKKK